MRLLCDIWKMQGDIKRKKNTHYPSIPKYYLYFGVLTPNKYFRE